MMKKDVTASAAGAVAPKKPDFSLIDEDLLKSRIYTIRGIKVMLDADLAEIYGYSTKDFNRQVKNNFEKFDEDFRFRLNSEEFEILRCKNCTSSEGDELEPQKNLKSKNLTSSWGGARYAPYAFTEQGIYMLMTVLKGEQATAQSKALIRLFKQMKDYIATGNAPDVELSDVRATGNVFHDRYIYLDFGTDTEKLFHCGASSKDAGNKITTIMQLEDIAGYRTLFERLLREGG